jgi:hypothetical protein
MQTGIRIMDLTFEIPEETWIAACKCAADESLSPSEWVEQLMRRELAKDRSQKWELSGSPEEVDPAAGAA